ncbi:xanthine dehydrogenase small subunit [Nitratireductor sp. CH_MIT9313-5]|uniref:xanthine dehydrogenase small subunit n=1 Tax=Nitratireductor sp. CH_MIT9313-5 TaxID=3107764 RepID=UPI00300B9124
MTLRREIRFLLNEQEIRLDRLRPGETLLDFLRLNRRLTGTKEGCAEGDCGACTVLVGRLTADGLVYEGVNACIRFLASLDGCHVVTVEHVRGSEGKLHPVQQALVDHHGSQCGFCTPGIVMSLYALWMANSSPSEADIEKALQGNLCRCTGYAPIIRAALAASQSDRNGDPLLSERSKVMAALQAMHDGQTVDMGEGENRIIVPANVDDFASALEANPDATIVAGSTDVGLWVTKQFRAIHPAIFLNRLDELRDALLDGQVLKIGAGVSYTDARHIFAEHIHELAELLDRIGGDQVRNMGTIGGNIANGSPIGDMPPSLIALGATLVLRKGSERREMPLEDYFIDYGKQDRKPGEFVERVDVPLPAAQTRFHAWKISKRREEDITAVLGAFAVTLNDENVVTQARIAYGGMAATPKRARAMEEALIGRKLDDATVERAMEVCTRDFTPISDMRASADYRMMVARNLIKRFQLAVTTSDQPVMTRRHQAA